MTKTRSTMQKTVRCAVYTRKSTEEGLEQDFNTLDAQRESGEAFIKSQAHEGWICLEEHFDDGGYTGGNMDRPALKQLMSRIEAGQIDCVVVYKVDRLSRSLLDFARMMETFERQGVSFVSVTQQFNTASSMGRLILNVLLSFAQFEREMISERTRDKIAATRRKGKWSGGMPLLGYDVVDRKLVVNEAEADRIQEIFSLYIERQSLLAVVQELDRRGWANKIWTTRKGIERGGRTFTKTALHRLLTNVTYAGKVRHKREVFAGEHTAIVAMDIFEQVQAALHANACARSVRPNGAQPPLLRGLLRCAACHCAMINSYSSRGARRYRYYLCTNAQKRGWTNCPAPSVPAAEIERFVVEEIRSIGRDPQLLAATLAARRELAEAAEMTLKRATEVTVRPRPGQKAEKPAMQLDQAQISAAFQQFENSWGLSGPSEQSELLKLLIKQINFDGRAGNVEFAFNSDGIGSLSAEGFGRKTYIV